MARQPSERVKAYVARAASTLARRLGARAGMLGRAVRALDEELNLEYLARIAEHEEALIDGLVAAYPPSRRLRVSIVVPTYGVGMVYVRELLESIEAQSYPNWEVCFADDCDPERAVAAHLVALARERPERFRYRRHEENRGIAAATRMGLSMVRGDLVAFVDADDLLHRRALEAVVSRFEGDERVDFVYTDHDTTSDLGFRRSPIRKPAFSPELLQIVNYVNHLVVVRKSCLDRCEGAFADGTSGSQDWDLCLRLVEAARKVSHVPAVLYHWRGRPGSVAADTDAKPWVHEACLATRRRHLEDIDGRLQLAREQSQHRYHYEPDLRRDGELPAVRVMMATATGAESYPAEPAYAGPTQTVALAIAKESTNGDVLDRLRTACNDSASDDGLVWLIDGRRRIPEGELERLAAFAIQPGVGAVWPFRSALARLCYTRHPSADRLAQLARVSNAFTRFSGNVLTGPFHGLLVRTRALRQALVRLEETGPDARAIAEFRRRTADLDAVGASIGLALIASGLRNVSCRGMMCDIDLEDAVPPDGWLPDADPWL